jgi:hypothetical protein
MMMTMYSTRPNLLIGFHGCDESVCQKVISGEEMLHESRNRWNWLGFGRYFWENNYERAFDWARRLQTYGKIKKPAVLGAVLDLGLCLDLLDTNDIRQLSLGYRHLIKIHDVLPTNQGYIRILDCAVIEEIHDERKTRGLPPYDSVRSIFLEGVPTYPRAGFLDKNHIQICVRNPNCVKGFFLPRGNDSDYAAI